MEFKSLKIIEPILRALEKKGYVEPTPIQEKTIPLLLDNKDVIGIAQTGTGKTAAFVIPILQKLEEKMGNSKATTPKALILAPTRELAEQITESFKAYGRFLSLKFLSVYGGVGINPQVKGLQKGADIVIATPGRLLDLMNQRRIDLNDIEFFVLDEADRMLDMGFLKDINKIATALPKEKQSLFFSATMSEEITRLTKKFLNDPVRMEITPQGTPIEKIDQCVFFVDMEDKSELLLDLIEQQKMDHILIFVKTKHKTDKVARILNQNGIRADSIHGNKSQPQRQIALKDFKSKKIRALVATDIAARGIDVQDISHVINFDLPNESENYIHRIGRTARAGSNGTAYSFCAAEEREYLNQIERITKSKTPHAEHKYHSNIAKNATGREAKPKPRSGGRYSGPRRNDRDNRKSSGNRDRRNNRDNKGRDSRSRDFKRSEKRNKYFDKESSSRRPTREKKYGKFSKDSKDQRSKGPRQDNRNRNSRFNKKRSDSSRGRSGRTNRR
jgi:ATP-dependent RNA helicase RhlE